MLNSPPIMSKVKIDEWMWRFLALAMMFSVAWTVWIIYQLNPPSLITNAAFEAAAKAKFKNSPAEGQSAQGVIAPSGGADGAAKAPPAFAAASAPAEAPKEPPVNPEKLKFSDTIVLPDPVPNTKK